MGNKKSFVIPEHVVPEQTITRCYDCPWFHNRGGSWGEDHTCDHDDYGGGDLYFFGGDEIASNCPILRKLEGG